MAQLVEHHLAKVRVASSNLVVRSRKEGPGRYRPGPSSYSATPLHDRPRRVSRTVVTTRAHAGTTWKRQNRPPVWRSCTRGRTVVAGTPAEARASVRPGSGSNMPDGVAAPRLPLELRSASGGRRSRDPHPHARTALQETLSDLHVAVLDLQMPGADGVSGGHITAGRTARLPDHDRDRSRPARTSEAGARGGGARRSCRRRSSRAAARRRSSVPCTPETVMWTRSWPPTRSPPGTRR